MILEKIQRNKVQIFTKKCNSLIKDIKLSKVQISKIVQSSGYFGSFLDNLDKKSLPIVAIPIARNNFPGLVSNITSNAINKFKKKSGKRVMRAGKGFTLFISNEDLKTIIKIIT